MKTNESNFYLYLAALAEKAEANDTSFTPLRNIMLIEAARRGHLETVQVLLTKGAKINHHEDGNTALTEAAQEGHTEIVRVLLDQGAEINHQTKSGFTALTVAAYAGQTEMVRVLLDQGAEINHQNRLGFTALAEAAIEGHIETVRALLAQQGVKINLQNQDGDTPLILAARAGHQEIAELIKEEIREQQIYPGRKKEIELFFLGKQQGEKMNAISSLRLFSSIKLNLLKNKPSEEKRPAFYIPETVVNIIDDYLRPTSIAAPTKKR